MLLRSKLPLMAKLTAYSLILCFSLLINISYASSPTLTLSGSKSVRKNSKNTVSIKVYPKGQKICAVKIYVKYSTKYIKTLSVTPSSALINTSVEKNYSNSTGLIKLTAGIPRCTSANFTALKFKYSARRKTSRTTISYKTVEIVNSSQSYVSTTKKSLPIKIR